MGITEILEGIELADAIWSAVGATAVISEILPHAKGIKANSAIQLIINLVKAVIGVLKKNSQPIPEKKV